MGCIHPAKIYKKHRRLSLGIIHSPILMFHMLLFWITTKTIQSKWLLWQPKKHRKKSSTTLGRWFLPKIKELRFTRLSTSLFCGKSIECYPVHFWLKMGLKFLFKTILYIFFNLSKFPKLTIFIYLS